jgi:hypothetical protein
MKPRTELYSKCRVVALKGHRKLKMVVVDVKCLPL